MNAIQPVNLDSFSFEGIIIERVIIHKIFARSGSEMVEPKRSKKFVIFPQEALDTLQLRIYKALGNRSHGIEMSIAQSEPGSFFQKSASMLSCSDDDFISLSRDLAVELAKAQMTTNAPGGMLAIIKGRVGPQSTLFLAAIKADIQDGFKADEDDENVTAEYISSLLLTEAQKLYKIGFLTPVSSKPAVRGVFDPADYRAFLFDHLMTATETRSAAAYFYNVFLGMSIQSSSKKLTQDFFEHSKTFIDTALISSDEKLELHEALRAELRSQTATLSAADFSSKHIPKALQDNYIAFLDTKGFPKNAIAKDTAYISTKLKRRRKYVFDNGVWISTPPEAGEDSIKIESDELIGTTTVTIYSQIAMQK
ncbi:nucleoid-associated protein [Pseudomonas sp. 148P]|uniref:Nucleoid-associated protein n=1 Tax=Pseudomonas ulcerans TaxID=3115852 RepID=A0ABU7HL41_9PSED|nr:MULTISPECIES: nucleoid-associated protein [unclassified Pseudomonas]MEE1920856.1 nucleoid-associated protein [Pseudomonas sp. 147P]MEE1932243.1 nucleoid-associated protein [Pseudomonas sp. 148P]